MRVPKQERDGSSGEEVKNFTKKVYEESEMGPRTSQLQRLRNIKLARFAFEDLSSCM